MSLVLWSPLVALGCAIFLLCRNNTVSPLLKWWSPLTKEVMSHKIDERYSKAERIQIDGLSLASFGVNLMFFFTIIDLMIDYFIWFNKLAYVVLLIICFIIIRKTADYLLFVILNKLRLIKYL